MRCWLPPAAHATSRAWSWSAPVCAASCVGRCRSDKLVIPWCAYTRPELAHVGATSRELQGAGRAFDRYRVEFGELDRGQTDDAADGFAEVLSERGSDRILGAPLGGRDDGGALS